MGKAGEMAGVGLCVNMFTWRCAEAPPEPGAELPSWHSQLARVRGWGAGRLLNPHSAQDTPAEMDPPAIVSSAEGESPGRESSSGNNPAK